MMIAFPAQAEADPEVTPVEFNSDFLQVTGHKVDIARFARDNPVLPGSYMVDLALNGRWIARTMVTFTAPPGAASAVPCLDSAILSRLELDIAALSAEARAALGSEHCADLTAAVAAASVEFDQSALLLSISLPQAALRHKARGYVSPENWQRGVQSATLAYDTSVFRVETADATTTSFYAGLTGGLNLGDWHFRERGTLSGTNGSWHYQNVALYLQRDLPAIRSTVTIGDSFTDGALFDSFGFRGIALASDDRMRPESQQGYAPIVRGTAQTNARVRVMQNGTLILETTVSPGAFEIDDLYPTGYGGDLLVTVLESDGSQHSFTVPYSSLVQLLRPRVFRYSLAAGDLVLGGKRSGSHFFQGTLQYGVSNTVTGYAGIALASGYTSGLVGAALNTPLGAVALDATLAGARITPLDVDQGYSVRLSYSKVVPGILTNVSVAAYRYSSRGFWTMDDALIARRAAGSGGISIPSIPRQRNRIAANVSQNLGGSWGNLYLTGSITSYWNATGSRTQVQAGYSNVAPLGNLNLNYGLSYGRQRDDATGQTEDRFLLSLSLALSGSLNAPRMTASLAQDRIEGHSRTGGQLSLTGTLGDDQAFNYNANLNLGPGETSFGVGAGYRAPFAMLSASASTSASFNQVSFGASGGLVMHPGGITLANQLGDTIGIVEAPGAKGAAIGSATGARIDGAGYAIVPYLVPYRLNQVDLDPRGSAIDVDLTNTSQQIAPHANAAVMLKFGTRSGPGVVITARLLDGSPVPFGADVLDETDVEIGLVGQNGQMFLRGVPEAGDLLVKWGASSDDQCRFGYRLPVSGKDIAPLVKLEVLCRTNIPGTILAEPEPRITALPV
ncbi:fimbrial biogenesis outer membrane usher protein [Novosphingobium sp. G106]|uniref:fimbria/pilus outer membrane usher protein n=1 Tax=Novosphingobium sp. G106 TaxID=2849500 RepID=UPI001C2D49A9|nr:fimbria/pilus outer membrane usher protein [Novosphingobium sp. G106]MBV1691306.1 fimbrial biogenesis outer membrane usher protein [Novosphingobium sp. G106]